MKILLLARSLDVGGTEKQVILLSRGLAEAGNEVAIAVFYKGLLDNEVPPNVRLIHLAKKGFWDNGAFFSRLLGCVDLEKPEVICSYLTVPNLFAGLLRLARPKMKIVWGLRSSNVALNHYAWSDRIVFFLTALLSPLADLIISNSETAKKYHQRYYWNSKIIVIPNGLDTRRFRRDEAKRTYLRAQWGVQPGDLVIGLVGRLNPIKNHALFLESLSAFAAQGGRFKAICMGRGSSNYKARLEERCRELQIKDKVLWIDSFADMPAAYSAFDLSVLCSHSESFPNVVLEAMACGTLCVVTATTGDGPGIVGSLGYTTLNEPAALAKVYQQIASGGVPWSHEAIAKNIGDRFSQEILIENTGRELVRLVSRPC